MGPAVDGLARWSENLIPFAETESQVEVKAFQLNLILLHVSSERSRSAFRPLPFGLTRISGNSSSWNDCFWIGLTRPWKILSKRSSSPSVKATVATSGSGGMGRFFNLPSLLAFCHCSSSATSSADIKFFSHSLLPLFSLASSDDGPA